MTRFDTNPVLNTLSEVLTLATMVGLTFASAAALAVSPVDEPAPVLHQLPAVEVVVHKPVVHQLPEVVVIAKSVN